MIQKYLRDIAFTIMLILTISLFSTAQEEPRDFDSGSDTVNIAYGERPFWKTNGAISTIKGEELLKTFSLNAGNRLPGRLPGLTVLANSNEPGMDNPTLYIRGLNTYGSGRSVLIIVDGIESSYENLVPEEIESISVLKDAAALAIYGSRGANGVLLVSTKKGVVSPLKVDFSIQQGFSSALSMPDFLDSYDYATLYNEALANDGLPARYSTGDLEAYRDGSDMYFHPNVNWYDQILRNSSPVANYNLNFKGGNGIAKYFVLLNYASDDGLYKRTAEQSIHSIDQKYSRFNIRSNIDINVTKDFNFSFILGAQNLKRSNPKDNDTESMFTLLSQISPNSFPVYNPDGTFGANALFSNPLGDILNTGLYTSNTRNVQMVATATQDLNKVVEGLSASVTGAFNNYFSSISNKTRDYARYAISGNTNDVNYNQIGQNESLEASENAENHANKTEWQVRMNYQNTVGAGDIDAMLMYGEFAATVPGVAISYRNNGLRGRLAYAHNRKYIGEFAFAYNGAENFPKDNRWGFFPAVSLGWNLSNEDFLKESSTISYLKLRGSYGLTGNDNIGGTRFMFNPQPYVSVGSYYYGTTNSSQETIAEGQIRNGAVTWEKERKMNIGIEATLFDQVDFVVDVFNNDRYDILSKPNRTVPGFWGLGTLPDYNLGETNNRGIEAQITYNSKMDRDFTYYLSASMWYAKNKINYSAEQIRKFEYLNRTGHSIDQPFRLVALGLFNDPAEIENSPYQIFDQVQPGDIKYADQNNDGNIDQDDIFPVGYTQVPQISGGFELGMKYENFDLNLFLQGVTNRSVYLSGYYYEAFQNDGKVSSIALERWTPETSGEASYPRLSASNNLNNFQSSTFWMRDGSFLKLRNIEIGYSLSSHIANKLKIDGARLFVNGTNLISWDYMEFTDPEIQAGYPAMKTYSIGARFQF